MIENLVRQDRRYISKGTEQGSDGWRNKSKKHFSRERQRISIVIKEFWNCIKMSGSGNLVIADHFLFRTNRSTSRIRVAQ